MTPPPPRSTLFPYTTLFRSRDHRLPVAGQHGIERRDAAGRISRHAVPAQGLDWARSQLAAAVARHHGLVLEDKGLSLALHYRRAPRLGGYAHRLIRSLAARIGSQYCVQTGKRIVEMKPAGKDKGVAVLEFIDRKSTRLNSSHTVISYAVFCLKKKKTV